MFARFKQESVRLNKIRLFQRSGRTNQPAQRWEKFMRFSGKTDDQELSCCSEIQYLWCHHQFDQSDLTYNHHLV